MEQYLNAIIVLLFGGLVWFVKAKMADYDTRQDKHSKSISEIEVAAATVVQKMIDHDKRDDDRFDRIEMLLKEGRDDIREILRNVKR